MNLLIVNAGSSSLKLRVLSASDEVVAERDIPDWDGSPGVLAEFQADAIVHRVVHGGDRFDRAAIVDNEVERAIEELVSLAPLHQPPALDLIRASRRDGDRPVVACFDTSYHRTIPIEAATYALPAEWRERFGIRKFGCHGLSHAYVARRAPEVLGRATARLASCHLGAGASLCAIADGRSVDTTMGFTPVDGLVMATRAGSVDPGLLMWMQTAGGLAPDERARRTRAQIGTTRAHREVGRSAGRAGRVGKRDEPGRVWRVRASTRRGDRPDGRRARWARRDRVHGWSG